MLRFLPLLLTLPVAAQVPATDLFLLDLTEAVDTITLGTSRNLTARDGYDNQPSFTPDGRAVLYTSQRGEQTDIYRYDLAAQQHTQVTDTPTSEYSPTVMPGGERLSVIQVEHDGAQRLWSFRLDGTDLRLVLPGIQPVGYHAWRDSATVALFVLGEPDSLWIAGPYAQTAQPVTGPIGRSLHYRPDTPVFTFVHKRSDDAWWITAYDPATQTTIPLVETRPGREDYCWTPTGTLLMGDGATVWAWHQERAAWQEVADLAADGITDITRCTVSPDGRHLVLVAAHPK